MLIGISGKRGVGKSLAAAYLAKHHRFIRVSFADDLRVAAKHLLPFTENDLSIPAKKEAKFKNYDFSPRDFMINLGEFMRFHDRSYWLNRGLAKCSDPKLNYVFDDVRYKNEADAIKSHGGRLVRIERYEKQNPYGKNLDTPSETDLDDYNFDFLVGAMWNNSQSELYRQMDAFMGV